MNDKVILGEGCIYSTDPRETQLNNNVLVCGTSGSGKTMSIIEPRLLETFETNIVITMTKRKLVDKYTTLFKERGYRVYDLNFINPGQSNLHYDPMTFIQKEADVLFTAEVLLSALKDSSHDIYWYETAKSLLVAEIAYVKGTSSYPTFSQVLNIHKRIKFSDEMSSTFQVEDLDICFDSIEENNPNPYLKLAKQCWNSFRQVPPRTAKCIYSSLNTSLDTLFTSEVCSLIDFNKNEGIPGLSAISNKAPNIDFCEFSKEKSILFITTSAVNRSLDTFISLLYGQMFKTFFEYAESRSDGKLPIPTHVFCDDFATGSRIGFFEDYISIFREKELSCTILLQSESQLTAMYGSMNATTIINNCDSYVYTGSMDIQTASNISQRLNKPLEEVLYMPIGTIAVMRRGQLPIITERYKILDDKRFHLLDKPSAFRQRAREKEERLIRLQKKEMEWGNDTIGTDENINR